MTEHDPISDMVVRIKNSSRMGHQSTEMPASNLKAEIARVLQEEGYIEGYEVHEKDGGKRTLRVDLSYRDGEESIDGIERESKPSRRVYVSKEEVPQVLGGLGVAVISTSEGVMTGRQAREKGIGGEVLLKVW